MDQRIINTLNHIEANLSKVFNLDKLANIACLSPSQFHRLFKKEIGDTPFRFCQKIKLQSAYQAITTKKTSIMDLSISLGYKDYETFSRAFKKQFRLAPGDLKAIVDQIKIKTKPTEKIMVATFDDSELSDIDMNKLLKLTQDHNLTEKDLHQSQIYTVSKKHKNSLPINTIKNKYEMVQDFKIWQKLIKTSR